MAARGEGDLLTISSSLSTDLEEHPDPVHERAADLGPDTDPDALFVDDSEELSGQEALANSEVSNPGDVSSSRLGLIISGMLSLIVFGFFNWPQPDGWADLARPLLFLDTTPSGGDMGAHVWGPAYLRDNLLPQGRLSGWTPDWYAGFPAYQFYMVVPPLVIIAINAGLPWFVGMPLAAAALFGGYRFADRIPLPKAVVYFIAIAVAVMAVAIPYGISFKLVSVIGLVGFPLAAWKMGRLAGSTEPIPSFLALAAFVFIYDTNFTIYGGNIASTLAGEFSFSICLMLALLAIGMSARGMDNMLTRAPTAIVLGLVALTHVLPVFFLIPAVVLLVLMHKSVPRAWALAGSVAMALVPVTLNEATGFGVRGLAVLAVIVVIVSAVVAEPTVLERARWLLFTGPVSMLIAAFWLVPFVLRRNFFNDMGWEPIEHIGPALLTVPMKIALPMAAVGLLLSYTAGERLGMMFGGTGAIFAAAAANLGDGPVWNARLLPFYYLSVYMLAAIGVAMVLRLVGSMISDDLKRPDVKIVLAGTSVAAIATLIAVGMPLRVLPGGSVSDSGDGSYDWLAFSNTARSFVPGWIEWNYSGYEEKDAYAEYRQIVVTMDDVGADHGCGRAMWEHHEDLDRYGTPMALMLLPHWTDGCIGSMEGLYFESSASTPFHFLNQSMLSDAPSRPQRNLPYQNFDIDRGVGQLQASGVRYYMAQTDRAIEAARTHPDLTEMAEAQPFVIFQVAGSDLVEGLQIEPLVVSGPAEEPVIDGQIETLQPESRFEEGWVSQAVAFYNDPLSFQALPAEDGPDEWARADLLTQGAGTTVEQAVVTNIEVGTDTIAFDVDQVGTPVLVKASFFPNWDVEGAEGPWRVGPNMMAVVPTSTSVELSYGRTLVDLFGTGLTLLGLLGAVGLAVVDRGRGGQLLSAIGLGSFGGSEGYDESDGDQYGSDGYYEDAYYGDHGNGDHGDGDETSSETYDLTESHDYDLDEPDQLYLDGPDETNGVAQPPPLSQEDLD